LNRDGITGKVKRGSEEYAREELIAEMGASFLCAATGIDLASVTDNSAAYIAGWLTKLQNDKTLVLKAAAGAQKAADYLLNVER
jgi:antirestriction protein ArdC